MHGLTTIKQLNDLAVQNDPGFIRDQLAQAAEKHKGEPNLSAAVKEAQDKRNAEREATVSALEKESFEQLVSRLEALQCPSTLEEALTRKLKAYLLNWGEQNEENTTGC